MAKEVKVNLDVLKNAEKVYSDTIQQLQTALNKVQKSIEQLKNGEWKSNGSEAFFNEYDSAWSLEFSAHISYLEHLRDCLSVANKYYRTEYEKKVF